MLHAIQQLRGFQVAGNDRRFGAIEDVYFDDRCWVVRYLAVSRVGWLGVKRTLVPTRVVRAVEVSEKMMRIAPSFFDPLGYSGYSSSWAALTLLATELGLIAPPLEQPAPLDGSKRRDPQNLRPCGEIVARCVFGSDGEIGRIEDVLFDDLRWVIRRLVVATFDAPRKRVLVPPACFEQIEWPGKAALAMLTRSQIEASPPYDQAFRRASMV